MIGTIHRSIYLLGTYMHRYGSHTYHIRINTSIHRFNVIEAMLCLRIGHVFHKLMPVVWYFIRKHTAIICVSWFYVCLCTADSRKSTPPPPPPPPPTPPLFAQFLYKVYLNDPCSSFGLHVTDKNGAHS